MALTKTQIKKRIEDTLKVMAQAQADLETLAEEMQEVFDERSESWQNGDLGQAWAAGIELLEEKAEALADVQDLETDLGLK